MPSWTSTRKLALLAPPGQDPPRFLCWNLTLPQKHFLADGLLSAPKCFSEMCLPVSAPCEIYSPSLWTSETGSVLQALVTWQTFQLTSEARIFTAPRCKSINSAGCAAVQHRPPPTGNRCTGSMLKGDDCRTRLHRALECKPTFHPRLEFVLL